MKRKHKLYSKPKRPFEKARIDEEAELRKRFGLKNKKEIWMADAKSRAIKRKAKNLISAKQEDQQKLFNQLKEIGIKVNSIADILSLDKKDFLDRRLQTILADKKIAKTMKESRQLIVHKKVLVNNMIVNSPSYIVPLKFENKISLKLKKAEKIKIKKEIEK